MSKKYESLFYTFKAEDGYPGCSTPQTVFRGSDDMPGANFNSGYHYIVEPVVIKDAPHYHADADEYLCIFGGALPDVFDSWDAEVHFYMGPTIDTMEKIVVTEPTVIKIPMGWYHCPLKVLRVSKPIFFQYILLGQHMDYIKNVIENGVTKRMVFGENDPTEKNYQPAPWTVINEDGIESYTDAGTYNPLKAPTGEECIIYKDTITKPYSDGACTLKAPKPALTFETSQIVLAMPREITGWGDWCPCPQTYLRGVTYMREATVDIGFQLYAGEADAEVPHFHSSGEEYLFFMGPDPKNILDFDAEIEMLIGDDPDHYEHIFITSPTVVRVPANTWHAPIKFRKMNKPVLFQAAYAAGTWGVIYKAEDRDEKEVDGTAHLRKQRYEYMGNDTRMCIYNEKKRCNICGICMQKKWDEKKAQDEAADKEAENK